MNMHKSLPAIMAIALVTLSHTPLGLAGDNRTQGQPWVKSSYMQSEPQDENDGLKPKPLAATLCDYDVCPNDACPRMDCCPPMEPAQCGCSCPDASCCGCCFIRKQIFAEYLYLRTMNAGVEYAFPINTSGVTTVRPVQDGRTASVNPEYSSGFRAGGALWTDECTSIAATYSHYENNLEDTISANSPLVLRSMVMHPLSSDAYVNWLSAYAHQYIRFDMADLDYRHEFYCNGCASADYVVGIRYANLRQNFDSIFASTTIANVNTQVDFDGGGLRLGLEAERYGMHNFSAYGKASASFLGGEFRGTYLQGDTNQPVIAQTDWKEARFVTILDCEVGVYWTSCDGRARASIGYMVSGWMNVVKTGEFISSVQANGYHGPNKINGNGLAFDGLVARIEYNW